MSLEVRAACERCGEGLASDGPVLIRSHECPFCRPCAAEMDHLCLNCSGELVATPRREER